MRRSVGAVNGEAPAGRAGDGGEPVAMLRQPPRVILAHHLDAADEQRILLLEALEAHAPGEGQRLLGGVEHLEEMAAQPIGGKAAHQRLDLPDRPQQVPGQPELAVARPPPAAPPVSPPPPPPPPPPPRAP